MEWLIEGRGGSRTVAKSKMERFVIIVNGWKPLTIIKKHSILDIAAGLDPRLEGYYCDCFQYELTPRNISQLENRLVWNIKLKSAEAVSHLEVLYKRTALRTHLRTPLVAASKTIKIGPVLHRVLPLFHKVSSCHIYSSPRTL